MLKIGLTGGIGSGKTTVANYFAVLGVPVIDADQIARELVTPGQPALHAIVNAFGPDMLDSPDQMGRAQLNRARLRARVFTDTDINSGQRQLLESILHPLIRAEMQRRVLDMAGQENIPYVLLSIPLLVEGGRTDLVERILVVDVPEALQFQRVRARDGSSSEAEIAAILRVQASRQQRLAVADDVIVNDAGLEKLHQQVLVLHRLYQTLSVAN